MAQITSAVIPTSMKATWIIAEVYELQQRLEEFCCYLAACDVAPITPPLTVQMISYTPPITKPVPQTAQKLFPVKKL